MWKIISAFFKGITPKGWLIMAGLALTVALLVYADNQWNTYKNKLKEEGRAEARAVCEANFNSLRQSASAKIQEANQKLEDLINDTDFSRTDTACGSLIDPYIYGMPEPKYRKSPTKH